MIEFGTARPQLRKQLKRDLALRGLPRDKVLALIVSLLNRTCIRVGNAEYAKNNGSFGLTTLRDRHVKFLREGRAIFDFRGKGGLKHEVRVDDRQLTEIVHRCQDLPGQMLFQFVDDAGQQHGVDSTLVNEYLRRVMDGEFTAKDFRTWHATLRALALLSAQPLPDGATVRAIKQTIVETVREVASELRNTPAVCRKAYINPLVFMAWQDGSLHRILGKKRIRGPLQQERATLSFLKQAGRN
jgi:DNA topoisomerase IB